MDRVKSPLKYHGGKHYLAPWIVSLMPKHTHYVEPFAGGLSVLLAKDPEGVSEVINDMDQELSNFWRILQSPESFKEFARHMEVCPFSQHEFQRAMDFKLDAWPEGDPRGRMYRAITFFVRARQSLAGRQKEFTPLSRRRVRRGMNEQVSAWLNAVEGLPIVHARLRRVVILDGPATTVMKAQDGLETLFYLDPPYLPSVRACSDVYRHEMSDAQHEEMLYTALELQGKVMISGYPSKLYDGLLASWRRHLREIPNSAAGGDEKRMMQECVWCNF